MVNGNISLFQQLPDGFLIPVMNRPQLKLMAGKKGNLVSGHYVSGSFVVGTSSCSYNERSAPYRSTFSTELCYNLMNLTSNATNESLCLFLVPSNPQVSITYTGGEAAEYYKKLYNNKLYEPYRVFIIHKGTLTSNLYEGLKYRYKENLVTVDDYAVQSGYPKTVDGEVKTGTQTSPPDFLGTTRLLQWLNTEINGVSTVIDGEDYYMYPETTRVAIAGQVVAAAAKYEDFSTIMNINCTLYRGIANKSWFIAEQVWASMPIFTYDNVDGLYNYLKFGDTDGAINNTDLLLSQVNLATDWTIYVNGARKPNIYITMESKGLEDFLASDDNKQGYSKEDFIVEYQYPQYMIPSDQDWTSPVDPSNAYITGVKEDITMPYNNSRSTSWQALCIQNYGDLIELNDNFSSQSGYEFYAQLYFRIAMRDSKNYFSVWCEFGIGIIGSPLIADFADMNNWGYESSIDDGSTVTIIYDRIPEDDGIGSDDTDYIDPDDEMDIDTTPTPYDMGSALTTTYRLTLTDLQKLGNYLWSATFIDDIRLINNSPAENIVSCKRFPVLIPAGASKEIVLGNVTAPVNGNIITSSPIIDIGTITYRGEYGTFLDYSPYTRLLLFLPFIGFTEIDASMITDKTLNIKYSFDIILGKCKAMLFVEGCYYTSFDGTMGVDVPIIATNRAQAEATFLLGAASSIVGFAGSDGTGADFAQAGLGILQSAVAMQYHSTRAGSYTPTCGWQETRKCYLIADIPTCQYPSSFGHDKGYPCDLTRTLATMSGYVVCDDNIDMSGFTCTKTEIDMIKQLLITGVYI